MEIWRVTLSYKIPGDRPSSKAKDVYVVVAKNSEEARDKAYECFSNATANSWVSADSIDTTIRRMAGSKIKFPPLTLAEDNKKYFLSAKISEDGSFLEYIVSEKSE